MTTSPQSSILEIADSVLKAGSSIASALTLAITTYVVYRGYRNVNAVIYHARHGVVGDLTCHDCFAVLADIREFFVSEQFVVLSNDGVTPHPVKTALFRDILVNNIDIYGNMYMENCRAVERDCNTCSPASPFCQFNLLEVQESHNSIFEDTVRAFNTYPYNSYNLYSESELRALDQILPMFQAEDNEALLLARDVVASLADKGRFAFCLRGHMDDILDVSANGMNSMTEFAPAWTDIPDELFSNLNVIPKSYPEPFWLLEYNKCKRNNGEV